MLPFHTDTSDVQSVSIARRDDRNGLIVQCTFIHGSNAQGCMVTIELGNDSVSVNLTHKNTLCLKGEVDFKLPVVTSGSTKVLGYDIEHDGSISRLAIPGKIVKKISPCAPATEGLSPCE